MSDTCKLCRFVLANTRGDGNYRCVNQESPRFGQQTGPDFCNDNYSGGCPQHEEFDPKPDMSFKDALEMLVMLPRGAYPTWFFKFGQQGELKRPFYGISFENNKQMLDWRDALQVCFDELMRLKREAGDFEDSKESKGENVKEICKNCEKCKPTYKGGYCEKDGKRVKLSGTCEEWREKRNHG